MPTETHASQKPFNRSWRETMEKYHAQNALRKSDDDKRVPIKEGPQIHQFIGALMEYDTMSGEEMG
jgi:hypothetical protein